MLTQPLHRKSPWRQLHLLLRLTQGLELLPEAARPRFERGANELVPRRHERCAEPLQSYCAARLECCVTNFITAGARSLLPGSSCLSRCGRCSTALRGVRLAFCSEETLRFQIQATPSSLVATAAPPGLRWPVVVRLLLVGTCGLGLFGDPRTLSWATQAFWLVLVVGLVAMVIHTLLLARTRSRLHLDRKTATLVSSTAFGSQTYSCALQELQLGPVRLLQDEEGEDGMDTFCLQIGFGAQRVEAFVAHEEFELSFLRSRLVDWLNLRHLKATGSNDDSRQAAPRAAEAASRASS